jgi:murein L,D-transpeptidase YafK
MIKGKVIAIVVGLVGAVLLAPMITRNWANIMQSGVAPEERIRQARERATPLLEAKFKAKKLNYPPAEIYLRAFKDERLLELWAAKSAGKPMTLVHAYPVAGQSGKLGPKRREGDRQVPEGFYEIDRFNPASKFWLSLGINYPNASDRILSDKAKPGGDIFIHGDNRSIGCLAMTDPVIEEIYVAALDARKSGQKRIRVDIFPSRNPGNLSTKSSEMKKLWLSLQAGLNQFESAKRPPKFKVATDGGYVVLD